MPSLRSVHLPEAPQSGAHHQSPDGPVCPEWALRSAWVKAINSVRQYQSVHGSPRGQRPDVWLGQVMAEFSAQYRREMRRGALNSSRWGGTAPIWDYVHEARLAYEAEVTLERPS
jgi:hypothetical protein